MAKIIFPGEGFHINDLLLEEGFHLEMTEEYLNNEEERYEYTEEIFMSTDEMLKLLNIDDLDEDGNDSDDNACAPFGISFDKLRSKMTDLLGNGMVMKVLRREGVGKTIQENAQVSVRYMGYFENQDEPFDASFHHGSSQTDILHLGQGSLIPGLELALLSMKKHEVSAFLIKPEYAFGLAGCLPRIPPNQEVLFLIQVTNCQDDDLTTSFNNLSFEDRNLFCNVTRKSHVILSKACDSFNKGRTKLAIKHYSKAANMLEMASLANEAEEIEQKKMLTRIYVNLTVCFNKENKPRCACTAFNNIPTPNAKSYFNHGRALIRLGEFGRATQELLTSKKLEPSNRDTLEELKLVKQLEIKYNSITKRLKDNCFLYTGAEEVSPEFLNATKELCATFLNDKNVLRIILPRSLTIDETQYISDMCANNNLLVVHHTRYNKEVSFIAKPNY